MKSSAQRRQAFSLVELLVVVAVMGIMSGLIIAAITNAAQESRMVMARQQQVVLQEALNAWIAAQSTGGNSLIDVRQAYNGAGDKLAMLQEYLQASTYQHFQDYSSGGQVKTDAMDKAGVYLQFSTWPDDGYPSVEMFNQ